MSFTKPGSVEIARFLNAGNILPKDMVSPGANGADWVLLPRNAVRIADQRGDVTAHLEDMVFIDGRFEVSVVVGDHTVTFYSDIRPQPSGPIELNIQKDQIVPLEA